MDVGEIWKGADMTFVEIMVTYWSLHGGGGGHPQSGVFMGARFMWNGATMIIMIWGQIH